MVSVLSLCLVVIVIVDRCMILKEVECVPGTVNFHRMLNILLINGIMLGKIFWNDAKLKIGVCEKREEAGTDKSRRCVS